MKRKNIVYLTIVSFLLTGIFTFNACKEEAEDDQLPRLFSPVLSETLEADDNTIIVHLGAMSGAEKYKIEISRDTFATIIYTFETDTTYFIIDSTLVGEELLWYTYYQLRGTAYSNEDGVDDSYTAELGACRTDKFPSIMTTPTSLDMLDTQVKVYWTTSGEEVTDIKVYSPSDAYFDTPLLEYEITDDEREAEEKILTGMTPETEYVVVLFSEDDYRGWETYTTREAFITGDNVIDLSGIDNDSILADTLPDLSDGAIVVIEGGRTYATGGYTFTKSVTIRSGYSFAESLPVIDCSENFNASDSVAKISSIVFMDVAFSGSFSSNYVLNINIDQINNGIDTIKFDGCEISNLRGIMRMKESEGTIGAYTITDCIVDSINGYGLLTVDHADWSVGDILLENSTFSRCSMFFISRSNTNSVTIESCTFNQVPATGSCMFRWRGNTGDDNITEGLKISNCIWGGGWDMATSGTTTVIGYAGFSSTSVVVSNTHATSEFGFASSELSGFPSSSYEGTATDLWQDPENADFTVIDNSFSGISTAGDPRWRP